MLITFDTDSLIAQHLTVEEYFSLIMITDNKQELLDSYFDTLNISDDQRSHIVDKLMNEELITSVLYGNKQILTATEKAKNILFGDDLFKEFVTTFPQSVIRTDGVVDFLRTDLSNAETAYKCYVGRSRDKHNHILNCLKAEIKHRNETGSMSYMKRILSWITNRSWTSYEDSLDAILTPNKDLGYGTNLI